MDTVTDQHSMKHPAGLWVIATINALSCFGFAIINSMLILYTTGIMKIPTSKAYLLFATYNSLLFTLPLIGGYLSEKLGYKRSFVYALLLYALALLFLSHKTLPMMYIGLGLFTTGVAFFVPTYLVLQGKLYAKDDKRRESAFTISYMIMNLGFLAGGVSSGFLQQSIGYTWTFRIAAIVTLACFPLYWFGKKYIVAFKDRIIEQQVKWNPVVCWIALVLSSAAIFSLARWLLEHTTANDELLIGLISLCTIAIGFLAFRQKDPIARKKLIAFIILSYISVGFWSLYTLEPSLVTLFIKNNVNRVLLGFTIPSSTFYALDPLFIISLGGFFSMLWVALAKRNKNPSLPVKFTMSLMSMTLGFVVFIIGISLASHDGLTNMLWIVLGYLFLSIGELLVGPIGQSMVGRLSPEGMEGRLMGVWQVFTGFAGVLSGFLAQFALVPKYSSVATSNPIYMLAFAKIAGMTLIMGIISLVLVPFIRGLLAK